MSYEKNIFLERVAEAKASGHQLDPEVKAKWLAALRSGAYNQAKGVLKTPASANGGYAHCCVGVLGEVTDHRGPMVGEEASVLDPAKKAYHGLHHGVSDALAQLNDSGSTFAQIADLIEEHL